MYDLTLGQNGHFSKKKPTKRTTCLSCPIPLIKMDILLVNVDIFNQVEPFEKSWFVIMDNVYYINIATFNKLFDALVLGMEWCALF